MRKLTAILICCFVAATWVSMNAYNSINCLAGKGVAAALACQDWKNSSLATEQFRTWALKRATFLNSQNENYEAVIAATDELIKSGNASPNDYWNRGNAEYFVATSEAAAVDLQIAHEKLPDDINLSNDLSIVLIDVNKIEDAKKLANKVLSVDSRNAGAFHARGRAQYYAGKYWSAIGDFNAALDLEPDSPYWFNERGLANDAVHNDVAALEDYDQAIRLEPKEARFYVNRGKLFSYQGNNEKALADYTKASEIDHSVVNLTNQVSCLINLGKLEEASKLNSEAKKLDATSEDVLIMEGRILYAQDSKLAAEATYEKGLKQHPDSANLKYWLASVKSELGKTEEGLQMLLDLVEIWPKSATLRNDIGLDYLLLEKPDKALNEFTEAIKLDQNYPYALENRARANIQLANWIAARRDAEAALEIDEKREVAHFHLGFTNWQLGKTDQAFKNYARSLELDPEFRVAYENRAELNLSLNNLELALKDSEKALSFKSRNAATYRLRGHVAEAQNKFSDAITYYDQAIALEHNSYFAYEDRAWAKIYIGDSEIAYDDCEVMIKQKPESPYGYRCRAKANYNLDNLPKSIEDLDQALKLDAKYEPARFDRGIVKLALNQPDLAIEDYTKTISAKFRLAESYLYRGIARENAANVEGALVDYQKALDLADRSWAPEASARLRSLKSKSPQAGLPDRLEYPQHHQTIN
jgi:tetratricopeptide (TPR) repeat protein